MTMTTLFRTLRVFACALIFLPLAIRADDAFDAANQAYAKGDYANAAQQFQQIVDTRGYSAPLCFNLANAQVKTGHLGDAILNYERARYLAPGDADIDHNLQLARKQAGLDPDTFRWWQVVLLSINWTVWLTVIGICLILIFLATLGLAYISRLSAALHFSVPFLRGTFRTIIFVAIPLAMLMGFAELSTLGFNARIEGVIVASKQATLRLSPFASADSVGTIPEGELVTVEDRHDDYLRIEARDHHFGWIQEKDIAPVIAGSFNEH